MSAFRGVGDRITGPAIARTMAITEPLLRSGAGAGAIRAGIEYEALVRYQQERCSSARLTHHGPRTRNGGDGPAVNAPIASGSPPTDPW